MEAMIRDIENLNWHVSPSAIIAVAHEVRRLEDVNAPPPGNRWVYRFLRRWSSTLSMGKGRLEDKYRHAAKDPPTVIKFLENVSLHSLIA